MFKKLLLRARLHGALMALAIAGTASADTVTTVDGARLTGKIIEVTQETVQLETSYAGVIKVVTKQIATLEADSLTARFNDGTTVTGAVKLDAQRALQVRGTNERDRSDAGFNRLLAA